MVTSFSVVVDFAGRQQSKTVNPVSALCITSPASLVNCFQPSGGFKLMLLLGQGITRYFRLYRYSLAPKWLVPRPKSLEITRDIGFSKLSNYGR